MMKKGILFFLVAAMCTMNLSVYAQTEKDTTSLGLPGDNLDLYATLDLFLKSKTIEDFEKSLNQEKTGINNLDLDLDGKVDFIKVVTTKKDDSYTFVLQDAVSKTETQDVAVILVDRDKNKKVKVQMIGDKELYGKDYIIEPTTTASPAVTANPAYTGPEPPAKTVAATTPIVVETVPVVQYIYSPVYVPYVPPYYYGFYPPYFAAFTVMAVGIYRANNFYYHGGGYGYHNTVVINNHNHYNNYNNTRNTSNRVQHNNANGNYGNRGSASTRPSNGASNRPSASTRPSNGASNRPSNGPSASTRPANGGSSRGPSASTRPSSSNYSRSGGSGGRSGGGFGGSRGGGGRRR